MSETPRTLRRTNGPPALGTCSAAARLLPEHSQPRYVQRGPRPERLPASTGRAPGMRPARPNCAWPRKCS
eukprot:4512757-Pyramimonas_sp.AAC.1